MMRFVFWLILACPLLGLGSCAVNPVSGRQQFNLMSESQEVRTGQQGDAEVRQQYGVYDDPALQARIEAIGRELSSHSHRPNLPYRFTLLDSTEVNAFALPGGPIYITRGLLAYLNSEAQVAAVLGHEVGHVTARHGAQQYSATQATQLGMALLSVLSPDIGRASQSLISPLATAWLRGYGREHELEADRLGAEYLARTGRSPHAMIEVISVLKDQELFDAEQARREGREPRAYHGVFSTHPDNDTRLKEVIDEVRHLSRDDLKPEPAGEFLQRLDGLVWGDSPEQGMVRDGVFLHSSLGLRMELPPGWKTNNSPSRLLLASPRGDAQMQLLGLGEPRGRLEDKLRQQLRAQPDIPVRHDRRNGIETATLRGTSGNGAPFEASAVRLPGADLLLVGIARDRNAAIPMFGAVAASRDSLRLLSREERDALQPLRIRLLKLDRRSTYRELAKNSPLGPQAESMLRLINGDWPNGEPERGRTIKVVR